VYTFLLTINPNNNGNLRDILGSKGRGSVGFPNEIKKSRNEDEDEQQRKDGFYVEKG
jgi:hypothetical protein